MGGCLKGRSGRVEVPVSVRSAWLVFLVGRATTRVRPYGWLWPPCERRFACSCSTRFAKGTGCGLFGWNPIWGSYAPPVFPVADPFFGDVDAEAGGV